MILGRVVGTVWATRRDPTLEGLKFLLVLEEPLAGRGAASSAGATAVVAIDAVGAGVGERVLVAQGSSGRQTEVTRDRPVDAVIMAIVDDLDLVPEALAAARGEA